MQVGIGRKVFGLVEVEVEMGRIDVVEVGRKDREVDEGDGKELLVEER